MGILSFFSDMHEQLDGAIENIPRNNDMSIAGVLNWVYGIAGIVAVGFIVYGGINYIMAQGEPGKVKQASQTIAYALIGLVVVLLAAAITNFIATGATA